MSIYLPVHKNGAGRENVKYVKELRPTIQEDTREKREATSYNLTGVGLNTSPGRWAVE